MTTSIAIEVSTLTKVVPIGFFGRPKTLLTDVSFKVPRGSTVGFVGANGAGKSTTMKHIIGASRPTKGTVRVMGEDPAAPRSRRPFGYMPELPYLPPTLHAREIAALHAALYGGVDAKRVETVLDKVGLLKHADERVGGYSKGMQTRLTLALSLLHDPELLILDEPMSGLDPVGRHLVRQVLQDEAARGRTVLFSSHVLSDVERLCDRVVAIDRGRIVFDGSTSDAIGKGSGWTVRVRGGDALSVGNGIASVSREGDTWLAQVSGRPGFEVAAELRAAGRDVTGVEEERTRLEDRLIGWMGGSTG